MTNAKKPKVVINKGKGRSKYVSIELLAELSDDNDKFTVTYLRGNGDDTSQKLAEKIQMLNDEDKIKAVVKGQVTRIQTRDDDGRWIPDSEFDALFDWMWTQPAYQRPMVRAMYAAAADIKYKQGRLGN